MSKKARPRALPDNEAKAVTRSIRISPRKLNDVASEIRGMKVDKALAYLTFSRRRIAKDVKKTLESAIANAENKAPSRKKGLNPRRNRGTIFSSLRLSRI